MLSSRLTISECTQILAHSYQPAIQPERLEPPGFHLLAIRPPPKGNANFAWLQYVVERLEPGGQAAVVMANGALFSANPRERDIRMRMVEDGCVEALIALPPALFYNTGIPVTIWLLNPPGTSRDEILFVNASDSGHMVRRTHRELSDDGDQRDHSDECCLAIRADRARVALARFRFRCRRSENETTTSTRSVYLSRPPIVASYETAMSAIRMLIRRLEARAVMKQPKKMLSLAHAKGPDTMSALLGPVPTSWTETRLADICTLIPGATTHDDPDGSVPVLKPRNLRAGRLVGPTDRMSADEAAQRRSLSGPKWRYPVCTYRVHRQGRTRHSRSGRMDFRHWTHLRAALPAGGSAVSRSLFHPPGSQGLDCAPRERYCNPEHQQSDSWHAAG